MAHDLESAQHFIYIAGWSVWADLRLCRGQQQQQNGQQQNSQQFDETLGELLKRKAAQGVRVLVLLWDDQTSYGLLQNDGIMATRDEATRRYFRRTKVVCVNRARIAKGWFVEGYSFVQAIMLRFMFTHHQKIVLVDVGGSDDFGEEGGQGGAHGLLGEGSGSVGMPLVPPNSFVHGASIEEPNR